MTETTDLIALARQVADKYQLFEHVVCGICEQESAWDASAERYEPGFYLKYIVPLNLPFATGQKRATSYGLMQTMWQSVVEIGYDLQPENLLFPLQSLEWGCKLFCVKLQHGEGNYSRALQLWNGGGNPNYAKEVLLKSEKYLTETQGVNACPSSSV